MPRKQVSEAVEADSSSLLLCPIVGIGAPAGCMEVSMDLLADLPPKTGMAFVLVPDPGPDQRGSFIEISRRYTAMKVTAAEQGARPEPDCVYVPPPNALLTLSGGQFRLEPRDGKPKNVAVIDSFFRSLATDQKSKAVGAVLPGTNGDGADGLRAIEAEGGIAIDRAVAPAEIASELARLARFFAEPESEPLREIFFLLRSQTGIDFSLYQPGTVHRRIARRLAASHAASLGDYARLLHAHPREVRLLEEDLLVGFTRFCRNPELFHSLKVNVFPRLFERRPLNQPIRVWAAGCSTGEEVYSVAMALDEYTTANRLTTSFQIFGTDVSERAIEKARSGFYPETLAGQISGERLRRYFVAVNKGYQIARRLRGHCIFARHNLCTDPPFPRIDLLTCRNVLIYLGRHLQEQAMATFHYALKPAGFLVLGGSETIRDFSDLFDCVDRRNKVFLWAPSANPGFRFPSAVPGIGLPPQRSAEAPHQDATAANEELQSANEELETAREELQSSTEELLTVNDELQKRNRVLTKTTDDWTNLLTSINLPVLRLNRHLQICQWTPHVDKLLSVRPNDVGRPVGEIRLKLPINDFEGTLWEVLATVRMRELEILDREGVGHLLQIWPYRGAEGKVEGLALVLLDFDPRCRSSAIGREAFEFEGEALETGGIHGQLRQKRRTQAERLFAAQDADRQRVARELHDDVGQQLALIQMDIEQVQSRLREDPDSLEFQLSSLGSRVASLSGDVRELSHQLHPSMLDDLGLGVALRSLVEKFGEREGMPASFTRSNVPDNLPKETVHALFRITQEALRNVSKHAGKTHVRVLLEGSADHICLEIVDMGEGFDQEEQVRGLGLRSMAERAHLAGGTLNIHSQLGRGTSIKVTVPVSPP